MDVKMGVKNSAKHTGDEELSDLVKSFSASYSKSSSAKSSSAGSCPFGYFVSSDGSVKKAAATPMSISMIVLVAVVACLLMYAVYII